MTAQITVSQKLAAHEKSSQEMHMQFDLLSPKQSSKPMYRHVAEITALKEHRTIAVTIVEDKIFCLMSEGKVCYLDWLMGKGKDNLNKFGDLDIAG